MKLFDIDWRDFMNALPTWSKLDPATREAVLTVVKPTGPALAADLGDSLERLLEAEIVIARAGGQRVQAAERFRPFLRAARAMYRVPVFRQPTADVLRAYAREHWTQREVQALASSPYYSYNPYQDILGLLRRAAWVNRFLERPPATGADPEDGEPGAIPASGDSQQLVAAILDRGGPIEFSKLGSLLPDPDANRLARAIYPALAAGVLFAATDADCAPLIGLWPEIVARKRRPPAPTPSAVEVEETFVSAPIADDLAAVLLHCSARPPRLKADRFELYVRDLREVAGKIQPAPEWIPSPFRDDTETRAQKAVRAAFQLDFMAVSQTASGPFHCDCNDAAREWLAATQADRLRRLIDPLREMLQKGHSPRWGYSSLVNHAEEVIDAFEPLVPGSFMSLETFLEFHSRQRNPLHDARSVNTRWGWRYAPSDREVEDLWLNELSRVLSEFLASFGGIQWGRAGREACFAITEVGRYMLGLANTFELEKRETAQVVVQPNFEIVFLAPSQHSAVLVAPLAERLSTESVGTLFEITRTSILDATAGGLDLQEIIARLEQVSMNDLPKNVLAQIESWCRQLRRVRQREITIVECPDQEAARRVLDVLGRQARPLTETIVVLTRTSVTKAERDKLAAAGISLEYSTVGP